MGNRLASRGVGPSCEHLLRGCRVHPLLSVSLTVFLGVSENRGP